MSGFIHSRAALLELPAQSFGVPGVGFEESFRSLGGFIRQTHDSGEQLVNVAPAK
jgi:hypothetical protein